MVWGKAPKVVPFLMEHLVACETPKMWPTEEFFSDSSLLKNTEGFLLSWALPSVLARKHATVVDSHGAHTHSHIRKKVLSFFFWNFTEELRA